MLAIAARQMGYRVHVFSPEADTPAGQVADREIVAPYDDLDAVAEFAKRVDVVTFEFENIPNATAEAAAKHAIVRPDGRVLHTTQHRLREKEFLSKNGFPVTPFRAVRTAKEIEQSLATLGPGVLKTASFGYDGKGQSRIKSSADIAAAIGGDETVERIYEQLVDFDRELSVVAARSVDGSFAHWGVIENRHENHILDLSISPADVSPSVYREATEIAQGVLTKLDVVGVFCVEFFLTKSGAVLINELAPRPHNSGHLTIEASMTSQFQQQLRAVCGLPLGSTEQLKPAAMVQILGDLWSNGTPNWPAALTFPGATLHLYGKTDARRGRKMGHLTVLTQSPADAAQTALRLRSNLVHI